MLSDYEILQFEKEWRRLSIKICQAIYINAEIQNLKAKLQKTGFLSLEEKSTFIEISNRIKYEVLQQEFGPENSEKYAEFTQKWFSWFQKKSAGDLKNHFQRNSVDHIMVGSTPEPEKFLLHFEHEIMGSYQGGQP